MHKILSHKKFYFMPLHVSSTCAHHQVKIPLHRLWYHHTYRFDDTRGCVMQFWPPDDEHMCSKHVDAWSKTYCETKFCASRWLNTEINILRCTVSKTSKFNGVFLCFAWISEQTAIISLYNINWLVFTTETVCLLRGTSSIFASSFAVPTVPAASYYRSSAHTELFSLRLRKSKLNSWTVPCQQSYFLLSLWYEKPAGIPDRTTALLDALCCCFPFML